ncbi:MAG TPA: hypothetical protein VGO09_00310 [Flavisolibacter sp.]|jgi:hypothetical protein|nr:hypothetical protein [Flavisolibacter sp.]
MSESFEIPVIYKGKDLCFNASLFIYGYTHKIQVEINGYSINFEPDEERNYRAVVNIDDINNLDATLIKEIAKAIENIVK